MNHRVVLSVFLGKRCFLRGLLWCCALWLTRFHRSTVVITPNGTRVTSNIANPTYVAPSDSTTFAAGRTGSSSATSKDARNVTDINNK